MQHSPSEIKEKLLKALDKEYNVVDMAAVVEIISILEKTPITKEALETTRLGRYINELRRKTTNEVLAKRAKDLVRRWRDMILPQEGREPPQSSHPSGGPGSVNGGGIGNISSATGVGGGGVVPVSPALVPSSNNARFPLPTRTTAHHPPHPSPPPTSTAGGTSPGLPAPPPRSPASQPYAPNAEAASRTHASNKRLRKESPMVSPAVVNGGAPWVEAGESSRDSFDSAGSPARKKRRRGGTRSGCLAAETPPPVVPGISDNDIVKEKIASFVRTPRLKTTQELVAGLQAGHGGVASAGTVDENRQGPKRAPHRTLNSIVSGDRRDMSEVSKNKSEHMERFLQSTVTGVGSGEGDEEMDRSRIDVKVEQGSVLSEKEITRTTTLPVAVTTDSTVEEILSRLPPIDPHVLSEEEEDVEVDVTPLSPASREREAMELLEKVSSGEQLEGVTGNYGVLPESERVFREWHECVSLPSLDGDLLLALPYTVVD
ncbi:formin-like protein 6 [Ischnura elegans]|uniref:formin-like protein 6 n=1 Tax=Ischnura elegans TaxID=197161 RepID=UPI001ED89B29|nr:formin-like protein 6 [Ischnura elegans]